jgi:hypothetical protein
VTWIMYTPIDRSPWRPVMADLSKPLALSTPAEEPLDADELLAKAYPYWSSTACCRSCVRILRAAGGQRPPHLGAESRSRRCTSRPATWRSPLRSPPHFALDALDSYADTPDDPTRLVPNPVKATAKTAVESARVGVRDAEARLSAAIDDATSRTTPSHLPLHQVRPDARLLDEERKLLTHAIRMAAHNAESTLARMLRPYYSRADDEARALLREAFTLSGDLHISGDTLHVRLDPATAPRRSRALHAPLPAAHRDRNPLPGHRSDYQLRRQGSARHLMI